MNLINSPCLKPLPSSLAAESLMTHSIYQFTSHSKITHKFQLYCYVNKIN